MNSSEEYAELAEQDASSARRAHSVEWTQAYAATANAYAQLATAAAIREQTAAMTRPNQQEDGVWRETGA